MGGPREPSPSSSPGQQNAVLSLRFCIADDHGLQEPKVRPIDDLAKSLVNGAVGSSETYCPQGLDSCAALTRVQASHGADQRTAWPVDCSHAYKTIAPHPGSADAAYIFPMNPTDNMPYKPRIPVQPLGCRRAPGNWRQVVTII